MASDIYLGIDLGTTALKAVLSDGRSRVLASETVAIVTTRPKPGWSEQHPDLWWKALVRAAKDMREANPGIFARIAAISFSGQMHGAVLRQGARILRPAILHNDGRALGEAHYLNQTFPHLAAVAGVRAMAGFTAPKLLWLKQHEPHLLKRAEVILSPKDDLRFRLTGEYATDPVDASGMWLFDVAQRKWQMDLCRAVGLREEQLPQLRNAHAQAGCVHGVAARQLGLKPGTPVICGTGDAAANSLGLGLINDGEAVISMGTAGQILVTRQHHLPAPDDNIHAFAHALPHTWFQMAALLNGASPLAWIVQRLGQNDIPALLRAVEKRMARPSRLLFLPYLAGERTPHDDPQARGAFFGLDASTDAVDLTRAVMEGVALSLADCFERLRKVAKRPGLLYATGGGTRSSLWCRMVASALDMPIHLARAGEYGAALGAARLARFGITGESPAQVFAKPARDNVAAPDLVLAKDFARRLPEFRALYEALRPIR